MHKNTKRWSKTAMAVHVFDTGHRISPENVEVSRRGLRFTLQRLIAEAVENTKRHSVNKIDGLELASLRKTAGRKAMKYRKYRDEASFLSDSVVSPPPGTNGNWSKLLKALLRTQTAYAGTPPSDIRTPFLSLFRRHLSDERRFAVPTSIWKVLR
ncbi:hypothetical protein T265_05815 [Opisthorchis viverrini]|uniref:Uncharacterized protein n=1 Tax=Opisthorchis viverrini TaxID=6198 RepID=A0A074ZJ87_OPIVI|nr:hypothetical protein T265_05815 [Opisthorchis viverrini]KER27051.1 hypothetical protein T265_05815 [Opisthorchis viverrini]